MYDAADETQHEPTTDVVTGIWHTGNGAVPVRVIAWSLGATRAYVLIGVSKRLEAGNFSATWVPVAKLTLEYH